MKLFLKITIGFVGLVILFSACTGAYLWYVWSSNLPYVGSVKEYQPPLITEVYSDSEEIIGRFWEEKRILVSLEELPGHLVQAFIAAEDSRFFEHKGVDIMGIIRAFFKNLSAGKIEQGGSTITQQVTRALLLRSKERTLRRKAREAMLSIQLEKSVSKEDILYMYLNHIYLGQGAYGVEAAARTYFNKPAQDLDLAESALLAGLPQAPARYSPVSHFEQAKGRQRYVLERMLEEGYITKTHVEEALAEELEINPTAESTFEKAPYFTEHVRRYLVEKYGRDTVYRGGLKVYTTVNLSMQAAAQEALSKGLYELDKREGYGGPLKHLAPEEVSYYKVEALEKFNAEKLEIGSVLEALVEEVDDAGKNVTVWFGGQMGRLPLAGMKWSRKPDPEIPYYSVSVNKPSEILKAGDVILVRLEKEEKTLNSWVVSLEQMPEIQGAIFCMETATGEVKAMVGGRDFSGSQFNRAVQSRRQPGSAFKPIIYAAALDWGMNPAEILMDAPYVSDQNADEEVWKPKNYKEKFFGPTLFRTALAKSRNVITVKILKKIGINYAIQYARNMGIESELAPDLSLALGSSGVSLMELTRAYSVFARGGTLLKPHFVTRILDRSGRVIEERQPESSEVISKETAFVMTELLKAVIQEGTGWRVKELKRPAAGKTGTTNNLRDAWFLGYTPELVTGVWVGYDDQKEMGKGETGSRAASPIWLYFMLEVLKDRPVIDFQIPKGVVFAKIDAETGLLASPHSEKTIFQAFKEGTEPKEYSPPPASPQAGQFSRFDMSEGK